MDYLCLPHTIVYLFNMFPTFSDLLLTLFIFAVIDLPMFWLFIVLVDCAITIASDSDPYGLLVISDPSDAISTSPRSFLLIFYLPLPLQTENNIVLCSLALRKTSYRFASTHTAFYCVPKPYTTYIDLDTPRSTSFYCVLLIILCFSSRFIGFASISFDLLIQTSDYVYGHIPSLTLLYPITIDLDIHLFYHHLFFTSVIAQEQI
jgi:hypothetical protein